MSFIKKDKDKGSSIWDWIILGGLIIGGLGLWLYLSTAGKKTSMGLMKADSLFKAGEYEKARTLYEELGNADVYTDSQDIIIYDRINAIDSILDDMKAAGVKDSVPVPRDSTRQPASDTE
jgi:pentatricopeptide repeat protein